MNDQFKAWARSLVGKQLDNVTALIYSYDGEKDFSNPQGISLSFNSMAAVKLSCADDGASIRWEAGHLCASDLGEYGEETVENIFNDNPWDKVQNTPIDAVQLVKSNFEGGIIGLRFIFQNSCTVSVINLGDELYVYDELPVDVVNDQKIEFI